MFRKKSPTAVPPTLILLVEGPAVKSVEVSANTFCLAVNKGPLGDLKSNNICVIRDTSFATRLGTNVPPRNRKSGPPVLPTSESLTSISLVT